MAFAPLLVLVCLFGNASTLATAAGWKPACRPNDEFWLVSTRALPCPTMRGQTAIDGIRTFRLDDECQLQQQSLARFAATTGRMPTVIFVHGNRVETEEVIQRGLMVYRGLVRCADAKVPIRFVIYSWPAERIPLQPLKDFRVKGLLTVSAGYHLAQVLNLLPVDAQVSLIGYSYGARVISSTLHLLAGGTACQYELENRAAMPTRYRFITFGAAQHHDWLLPGRFNGRASEKIDRALFLNNSCDGVLKYYFLTDACSNPVALGRVGMANPAAMGAARMRISQRDVCCILEKCHDLECYLAQPALMKLAWHYAAFYEVPLGATVRAVDAGRQSDIIER